MSTSGYRVFSGYALTRTLTSLRRQPAGPSVRPSAGGKSSADRLLHAPAARVYSRHMTAGATNQREKSHPDRTRNTHDISSNGALGARPNMSLAQGRNGLAERGQAHFGRAAAIQELAAQAAQSLRGLSEDRPAIHTGVGHPPSEARLVARVAHIAGYSRFSLTRASAVVNCQSALA